MLRSLTLGNLFALTAQQWMSNVLSDDAPALWFLRGPLGERKGVASKSLQQCRVRYLRQHPYSSTPIVKVFETRTETCNCVTFSTWSRRWESARELCELCETCLGTHFTTSKGARSSPWQGTDITLIYSRRLGAMRMGNGHEAGPGRDLTQVRHGTSMWLATLPVRGCAGVHVCVGELSGGREPFKIAPVDGRPRCERLVAMRASAAVVFTTA